MAIKTFWGYEGIVNAWEMYKKVGVGEIDLLVHTYCNPNLGLQSKYRQSSPQTQRYTYRVLQTIQMKLILLCVWAERAVLGSAKTALK